MIKKKLQNYYGVIKPSNHDIVAAFVYHRGFVSFILPVPTGFANVFDLIPFTTKWFGNILETVSDRDDRRAHKYDLEAEIIRL